MKYILGLSFLYESYKNKKALLRIHSNNRLIDEIVLDKDIETCTKTEEYSLMVRHLYGRESYKSYGRTYAEMINKIVNDIKQKVTKLNLKRSFDRLYEWTVESLIPAPPRTRKYEIPNKLFLFELEEEHIGETITVECINNNNNHTNGFLTKFSNIKFHNIFLIPKKFFYKGTILKIMSRICKNELMSPIQEAVFTQWQEQNTWPSAHKISYRGNSYDPKANDGRVHHVPLGGHFFLDIDVIKKHKIKMFSNRERPYGFYFIDQSIIPIIVFYDLINRINEDQ